MKRTFHIKCLPLPPNQHIMKKIAILALGLLPALPATADEGKEEKAKTDYRPVVHGTLRGKYEYQPEEKAGRFQVRTARVSIEGKVAPVVAYKAEIDLSDEGKIKMLDAYTRLSPLKGFDFTIGQMRVPFTIDAHRSPHQQYFANRSFIAKQVGNVRDVGATLGYKIDGSLPRSIQRLRTDRPEGFLDQQHQLFRQGTMATAQRLFSHAERTENQAGTYLGQHVRRRHHLQVRKMDGRGGILV